MIQCGSPCPRGTECDEGEECFGYTKCNYELTELKSYIMIRLDGPSDEMDEITLDIFTGTFSDMIRDYLADDLMMHLNSFDVIEQTRYSDTFDEYIDVKVTTTALYRLDLRRDFDNIIENIINLNQHEVKRLLKQTGSGESQGYFVAVSEIRARAIPITSSPSNSPSISPSSKVRTTIVPSVSYHTYANSHFSSFASILILAIHDTIFIPFNINITIQDTIYTSININLTIQKSHR